MKTTPTRSPMFSVLCALMLLAPRLGLFAQPVPHHFSGIAALPDQTIMFSLDGSVSNLFNLTGAISNQFGQNL